MRARMRLNALRMRKSVDPVQKFGPFGKKERFFVYQSAISPWGDRIETVNPGAAAL